MKVAETSEVSSMSKTPTLNEIVSELESIEPRVVINDAWDHLLSLWADVAKEAKAANKASEKAYQYRSKMQRYRDRAKCYSGTAEERLRHLGPVGITEAANRCQQASGDAQSVLGVLSDARRTLAALDTGAEKATLAAHQASQAMAEVNRQGDYIIQMLDAIETLGGIDTSQAKEDVRNVVEEAESNANQAEEAAEETLQYWSDSKEALSGLREYAKNTCLTVTDEYGWL